jgi:DNA end-binding protein Ku
MARPIWTGSISFGLVNVPVKLYSAVHQQDIHFNQFEEGTGAHIQYKRVSEKSGDEVPWEHIVKGYEVSKGNFVMVEPDELDAIAPEATRTIDIEDFVALEDIDPIYYEHTYYLAPSGPEGGAGKAYRLLLEAMEDQGKVGIGKVVLRTKQYLAAVRPLEGALALSTMLFADEVVSASSIDGLPDGKESAVTKREVGMAAQIIESLTTDWDPSRYHDTYRESVMELIERKAKGEEIVVDEAPAEGAKVVDLMAALEASLEASKKGGSSSSRSKSSSSRRSSSTSRRSSSGSNGSRPKSTGSGAKSSSTSSRSNKATKATKAKASAKSSGSASRRKSA